MNSNENDYDTAIIYAITDLSTNKVYIGSTTLPLNNRIQYHISAYNRYIKTNGNSKNYCSSFEILMNNNYKASIVEHFPCSCKCDLEDRELFHIQNTPLCVNIRGSSCDKLLREIQKFKMRQKYHTDESVRAKKREYYLKNKQKRIDYATNRYYAIGDTNPKRKNLKHIDYTPIIQEMENRKLNIGLIKEQLLNKPVIVDL